MKALIMAAGMGSRIVKDIGEVPKCTVPTADGTPMVRRSVQMMLDLGIEPVLCIGYHGEKIREALAGLPVRYYENPFFAVTNNVASLWFAQAELDGEQDVLLLSGDLYYPKSFLHKALDAKDTLTMFGDSSRLYDGDFYLHLDDDGYIDRYGPQLPLPMRRYEYMGFSKLRADFVPEFRQRVNEYVVSGRYNTYFEDIVISFAKERSQKVSVLDVAGEFWREYDYYEDYELILQREREGRS